MGCGCGQKVGSLDRPVIAGRNNAAEPIQVKTLRSVGTAAAGREVWATGDQLGTWLEKGWVELVSA